MYIVIIGLGEVGRHLLEVLEGEGHEIVAIDLDPDVAREIDEQHDVLVV